MIFKTIDPFPVQDGIKTTMGWDFDAFMEILETKLNFSGGEAHQLALQFVVQQASDKRVYVD